MKARVACAALLLAMPSCVHGAPGWLVASTRHFRVYGQGGDAQVRRTATQLEQYDALLREVSGSPPEDEGIPPLSIYILNNQESVVRSMGSHSSVIYGYYAPSAAGSYAVVPQAAQSGNEYALTPRIIMFHEYAHHFMLQNYPSLYSPWYVEGLAEFESTVQFEWDGKVTIGEPALHRIPQLLYDWGPPLERLIAPGDKPLSQSETIELYGRAWLLTHYLTLSGKRVGQLSAYLKARDGGADEKQAFQTAFHATPAMIDRELGIYFRTGRLHYMRLSAPPPPADLTVAAVSAAQAAMIPLIPRLRHLQGHDDEPDDRDRAERQKQIAALLADVRAAAAAYPGDAAAQEILGETETIAGDAPAAHAAAEAALRIDPANARALLIEAGQALDMAKADAPASIEAARKLVVKANRAAPNDPLPLIAYYRSFTGFGQPPPALAVRGLERAEQLAPQDDDVRLLLAGYYARHDRAADAAFLLRPVAFSPHPSGRRAEAQAMLAKLPVKQADTPPPATTDTPAANAPAIQPPKDQPKG